MGDVRAARPSPRTAWKGLKPVALLTALLSLGCEGQFINLGGAESEEDGPIDHMSTAMEIRDAACYSDFELATESIDAKLAESIQGVTGSRYVGEEAMREEIILGLRFNANLQKRLAFDTLEECLR